MKRVIRHSRQIIVGIVGFIVFAAGIALLVLPGPGILVVIVGLAILASEFDWAEGLLHRAKAYYESTKQKVTQRIQDRREEVSDSSESSAASKPRTSPKRKRSR